MGHGHHGGGGGFGGGGHHHHSNQVSPSSGSSGGGGGHHHHGSGFNHAMHEIKHEVKHDFKTVEHGLGNFGHQVEHGLNNFGHDVKHEFNHVGHQIESGFNDVAHDMNHFGNSAFNQAQHLVQQAEHYRQEQEQRERHERERHEHLNQHYQNAMNARSQMNYLQSQMYFNNMLAMGLSSNNQYYGMAHYGLGRTAYQQNQWIDASNHYYMAMQCSSVPVENKASQEEINQLCDRLHQEMNIILNGIVLDRLLTVEDCDQALDRLKIAKDYADAAKKLNPADTSLLSVQDLSKSVSQKKTQFQITAHEEAASAKLSTFNQQYFPSVSLNVLGMGDQSLDHQLSLLGQGKKILGEVRSEIKAAQALKNASGTDISDKWAQVDAHEKQLQTCLTFAQAESACRAVAKRFNQMPQIYNVTADQVARINELKLDLEKIKPYEGIHDGCKTYCINISQAIFNHENIILSNKIDTLTSYVYIKSVTGFEVTEQDMARIQLVVKMAIRPDQNLELRTYLLKANEAALSYQADSVSATLKPLYTHRSIKFLPCCKTDVLQLADNFDQEADTRIRTALTL